MNVYSKLPAQVGRWTHLAVTWSDAGTSLVVDGVVEAMSDMAGPVSGGDVPVRLGGFDENLNKFNGAVDEILIHDVAKHGYYLRGRAHPGLPAIRFLANSSVVNHGTTEAPEFPLRDYALHWGDQAATASVPFVPSPDGGTACYGLLNKCLGYAAWWRFNEGSGTTVVGSSAEHHYGVLGAGDASPAWVAGKEGTALKFVGTDGTEDTLLAGGDYQFDGPFTVEAVAELLVEAAGRIVTWSGPNNIIWSLYRNDPGVAKFVVGTNAGAESDLGYNVGDQWVLAAVVDSAVKLYVDYDKAETEGVGGTLPTDDSPSLGIGYNVKDAVNFEGTVDSVRIMSRALTPDEFLHYPLLSWEYE